MCRKQLLLPRSTVGLVVLFFLLALLSWCDSVVQFCFIVDCVAPQYQPLQADKGPLSGRCCFVVICSVPLAVVCVSPTITVSSVFVVVFLAKLFGHVAVLVFLKCSCFSCSVCLFVSIFHVIRFFPPANVVLFIRLV